MTRFPSSWLSWLAVLVLLGAGLLPASPAYAQAEPPLAPMPPAAYEPAAGPPGALRDGDGHWRMQKEAAPVASADAAASGGPDNYGYVWDDSAPLNWIDATNGTDTGLSGDAWNQRTGAIPLPFAFKYYEAVYSSVYIGAAGYVAFQDASNWYWDDQVNVPSPATPNPVVAPYSTPLDLVARGRSGRVFYKGGGAAPNRYFVVTWNDVQKNDEDDKYTFQVVLYENGDILFQYKTMTYGPDRSYYCGYTGIEDPDGLDGFNYTECGEIPTNLTIRYTRPAPSARVKLSPRGQGRFTRATSVETFVVTVYNNGELGADTYNVSFASAWPATVQLSGQALTDSNGDSALDTGAIEQGAHKRLTVQVQTPTFANVADTNIATLTVRSTRDPARVLTARLSTSVPTPFAQIYEDTASPGPRIALPTPNGQSNRKLTEASSWGGEMAISGVPSGGYIYVWDEWLSSAWQMRYAVLDKDGVVQSPIHTLATVTPGYFTYLGTAVAANGNTGVAWVQVQSRQMSGVWEYNYNVMFAILDAAGAILLSPTNLTNNTAWSSWGTVGVPRYYYAHIAASSDNRFFVTWNDYHNAGYDWTDNIYYTVRDANGQAITPVMQLSGSDLDRADVPRVTALSGNRFLLAYYGYAGGVQGVRVAAFTSTGVQLVGPLQLTDNYEYLLAMTQLSNGSILAVWTRWINDKLSLRYALLNQTSYTIANGPFDLDNPFSYTGNWAPSVMADADGRAVITWGENSGDYRPYHFYALIDSSGAQLVPPTPWLAARTPSNGAAPRIFSSTNGYGIAPGNSFAPTSISQPDAVVVAPGLSTGVPTGSAQVVVNVGNRGLPTANGVVVTAELDPNLTFLNAEPPPVANAQAATAGGIYTWNVPNLRYLSQGLIVMSTGVPSATIGARYPVTISVSTTASDANQENNTTVTQVMVAEQVYLPAVSRTDD